MDPLFFSDMSYSFVLETLFMFPGKPMKLVSCKWLGASPCGPFERKQDEDEDGPVEDQHDDEDEEDGDDEEEEDGAAGEDPGLKRMDSSRLMLESTTHQVRGRRYVVMSWTWPVSSLPARLAPVTP